MPANRADTPAATVECHREGIAGVGIHACLPVRRIERIHRRIPIIQQSEVHRRVGGRVVIVPASLLTCVGVISAVGRDKVRPRARGGGRPQVLLRPTLVTDLYGVIDVALVVSNRRDTGAGRVLGGKNHFLAVCSTLAVGGIGPHVVGGSRGETGDAASERADTCAVARVRIGDSRIVARAPTHASGSHRISSVIQHFTATGDRSGGNPKKRTRIDNRDGVAETADGKAKFGIVGGTIHPYLVVIQLAVPSKSAATTRSCPKVGSPFTLHIRIIAVSCRYCGKTRRIVGGIV